MIGWVGGVSIIGSLPTLLTRDGIDCPSLFINIFEFHIPKSNPKIIPVQFWPLATI